MMEQDERPRGPEVFVISVLTIYLLGYPILTHTEVYKGDIINSNIRIINKKMSVITLTKRLITCVCMYICIYIYIYMCVY